MLEDFSCLRMDDHRNPERGCDRLDSDVVMGRADAAGREQIIMLRAKRVDGLDDRTGLVGYHSDFRKPDSLLVQPGRDLRDVAILGPSGEDFVADHH